MERDEVMIGDGTKARYCTYAPRADTVHRGHDFIFFMTVVIITGRRVCRRKSWGK
jgi:hypothetical protein